MRESRFGCAVVFIHETERFERHGTGPNALIPHERDLWYGEPVANRYMIAIRGCIRDHDCARCADFIERLHISISFTRVEAGLTYELDLGSGAQSLSRSYRNKASPDLRNQMTCLCTLQLQL